MPSTTIYDTKDQFVWDERTNTFDENDQLIKTVVIFDDGRVQTTDYIDGVKSRVFMADLSEDGSAYSWDTYLFEYSETGELTYTLLVGDNGVSVGTTYEGGKKVSVLATDGSIDGVARPWVTHLTTFDQNGMVKDVDIMMDDQRQIVKNFEGIKLRSLVITDASDAGYAYPWESISTIYGSGDSYVKTVILDNGLTTVTSFGSGNIQSIVRTDVAGDLLPWETQSDTYFQGKIQTRETVYDNGTISTKSFDPTGEITSINTMYFDDVNEDIIFENGERVSGLKTDTSDDGTGKDWVTISTTYDDANFERGTTTLMDNGVVITAAYNYWGITDRKQIDADENLHDWETITETFHSYGQIASRVIDFDNGIVVEANYGTSTLLRVKQTDTVGDFKPWESIETFYNGASLNRKYIVYDNGLSVEMYFSNDGSGNDYVSRRASVDESIDGDLKDWATQTDLLNDNGTIVTRYTSTDDRRYVIEKNIGGELRVVEEKDSSNSGAVHPWWQIRHDYYGNGNIKESLYWYDNGEFKKYTYDFNGASLLVHEDAKDQFIWDKIETQTDENGLIEFEATQYDDGDVSAFLYENGTKASRLVIDNSDAEPWYARELIYDIDGNIIATNYYDTLADIPITYTDVVESVSFG
jgi:hypothetical protein